MRTTNSSTASTMPMNTASTTLIAIDSSETNRRNAEIERDGAALRRAGLDQARGQLFGPGIDVLDRDHHDHRRQHRARHIGEQRKQQRRGRQHRRGIDDHRKPAAPAEGAIGEARTDIDAVGDAAEAGRDRVGDAEAHQQAIVAGAKLAGLAGQLGAQQRVDRRDDRQRQRARQDHRRRLLQAVRPSAGRRNRPARCASRRSPSADRSSGPAGRRSPTSTMA